MKYGVKRVTLQVYFSSKVLLFAEVAEVNTEALNNIKFCQPWQNVFSYSYLGILFATAKNAEIRGLYI